jgi:hypothetical protein
MKRTTIFLPEALERDLQAEARRVGKPMASVVREALADYVVSKQAAGTTLSFVGCAAGDRSDIADRHENLLWRKPHRGSPSRTKRPSRRRKAR